MDYFSFQKLIAYAKYVITDSGCIQEETTFLKIPCLTLRPTTGRPSTTDIEKNTLITFKIDEFLDQVGKIQDGSYKKGKIPELWDGRSTERAIEILNNI